MKKRLAAVLFAALAVFTYVPAASAQGTAELNDIRTGKHDRFERIVLDMTGLPRDFQSREVTGVTDCGPGNPINVPGNEILESVFHGAAAHDENYQPTYKGPRNFTTPNLSNVKGVALTCDFEATLGIAVGYTNPNSWHRVYTLTNPDRVVIDVWQG
ncbi:hypothetical protein LFM09_28800 [Lentzea alba]|uniref:AMIN-like domain-containing (lipo)protein n=1 Tax=Lentzea alba TaxID=2714351 RepID=UPI0039BF2A78